MDGYLSFEFCWDAEIESGRHFLLKGFKGLRTWYGFKVRV